MPGPWHGWLLVEDSQGNAYEVINQARTAAYLSNPALALNDVSVCDVLDFGGCETYTLGPDEVVVSGGYIDFPGTPSGNYATIPSGAIMSPSGDMGVVVAVAADDWTPSGVQMIVGRWSSSGGTRRAWMLELMTTGALRWSTSVDGTASTTVHTSSSTLSAVANGAKRWVAAMFRANNGAAGRSTRFWQSTDGVTYTELGTVQTTAGTTTINTASTIPWMIGALDPGTSQLFAGRIYDISVRNNVGAAGVIGGTEIFRFDGNTDLAGFNTASAAPWTIVTSSGDPMTIRSSGSPGTTVSEAITRCDLVPLTFDTPAVDEAPWYNPAYPDSADALGFYVNEWTGLDDGHVRRRNDPRGGPGGGSFLGPVAAEGRTMALNIMLFGRSEAAVEYLFRWLSNTLNSVCATCATNSMLIRRFCGTTSDPWHGVAELRQVGVVQGLKWESDVGNRARCYIRRASFTLMAGDPCMYLPTSDVPTHVDNHDEDLDTFLTAAADDTRSICRPSCSELTAAARLSRTFEVTTMGATSLVVTWENRTSTYTYPFRAVVYYDPLDVGPDDPCGLQILGELYVRAMPPSTSLRWDVTGRTVSFRDSSTGGWTPSWAYVDANDPPQRRFFVVPCGTSHLVMEPASLCASTDDDVTWELDGIEFSPPAYPRPTLVLSERLSCV